MDVKVWALLGPTVKASYQGDYGHLQSVVASSRLCSLTKLRGLSFGHDHDRDGHFGWFDVVLLSLAG